MESAKDFIVDNSLNAYEQAVLKGLKCTKGGQAVKAKAISDAVSAVMSGETEVDGETMTVAEALVVKVVGDAIANPTTSKLKDLASIVGDIGATKVEIVGSKVDEELAALAIGESSDGAE